MIKKLYKILIFLFFLSTALSCTQNKAPDKDTLVLALSSGPQTLDPRFSTDANGMRMSELLFQSLVKQGPQLNIIGDAAESWSYKDGMYKFVLKKNLSFANGRDLLPEDIEYSFSEYKSSKSPFRGAFKKILKTKAFVKDGRIHVEVSLDKFSATFLGSDLPVLKIIPKKESLEMGDSFAAKPLGSGNFSFKSQSANDIVLETRKDRSFINFKRVVFKIVRDDFTRFQKMMRGEIDIAQSELPSSKIKDFEKKPKDFYIYKYPGLAMSYILINLKDKQLKKLNFRKAIAYGINRKEIIDYKLEGLAVTATSIITPSSSFFDKNLKPYEFNKEYAKKWLKGIDTSKVYSLKTSNSPTAIDNGRVITHQLKAIGINIKLQSFEWGTFYEDIKRGNFQLATMRWVGVSDPDIYRVALHSREIPPGRNRGFYKNTELDKMLDAGVSIENKQERIKLYNKVQKIVLSELPIIPLWYNEQVTVVNKRVSGYSPWKGGSFNSIINCKK